MHLSADTDRCITAKSAEVVHLSIMSDGALRAKLVSKAKLAALKLFKLDRVRAYQKRVLSS